MSRYRVLLVGLLTAVMLMSVSSPASAGLPRDLPAANLGDSFASGEGGVETGGYLPGSDTDLNRCHRSRSSAAQLLGLTPLVDITVDAACSGAVTANITTVGQYGEPPQASQLNADLKRVYVMIGGNDIGFGQLLGCFLTLPCEQTPQPAVSLELIKALPSKLDAAYAAIAENAPRARVIVLLYPPLLPPTSPNPDLSRCPQINPSELAAGNEIQAALNSTITRSARQYGFRVVDPGPAFRGHDVCSAEPFFYLPGLGATYHPNLPGRIAMAVSALPATV